nr:MAG TPA: hypothetical protein [Caudoviricetes sp.]
MYLALLSTVLYQGTVESLRLFTFYLFIGEILPLSHE